MADNNMVCSVCGKAYRFCPHCAEFVNSPAWMNEFDTEECYTIYRTLNSFWFKHITKDEAKEKLNGLNLNKVTSKDLLVAVEKLQEDNEPAEVTTPVKKPLSKKKK